MQVRCALLCGGPSLLSPHSQLWSEAWDTSILSSWGPRPSGALAGEGMSEAALFFCQDGPAMPALDQADSSAPVVALCRRCVWLVSHGIRCTPYSEGQPCFLSSRAVHAPDGPPLLRDLPGAVRTLGSTPMRCPQGGLIPAWRGRICLPRVLA